MAEAAGAGDGVSERQVARVGGFSQPGHLIGVMVWKVVRDAVDGVIDGGVFGEVGETVVGFWLAVRGVWEVGECLAGAGLLCSQ